MKITVKQLKRIIQEELQAILNEQAYGAQAAKTASPAYQSKSDTVSTTTNGKENFRSTSMYRGKQDFSPGAQRKVKSYASRRGGSAAQGGVKTTTKSGFETHSPAAAEKLEFEPWKGSITTQGTDKEFKETEFVQPADTRFGQLDTTRQVSESQLKRIIEEVLEEQWN